MLFDQISADFLDRAFAIDEHPELCGDAIQGEDAVIALDTHDSHRPVVVFSRDELWRSFENFRGGLGHRLKI
jgi:hypothetical protein